jgi:hypothetical protein
MRNLFLFSGLLMASIVLSSQSRANDEGKSWNWSVTDPNARYWPAYRVVDRPEGADCIRWNWQERAYYDYCPSRILVPNRRHRF